MADKKITYNGIDYDFTGISSENSNQFGWDDALNIFNPVHVAARAFNKGEGLQYVNKNTLTDLIAKTVSKGRALTLDELKKVDGMQLASKWQGTHVLDNKNWQDIYNQYLQFINQNKDNFGYTVDENGDKIVEPITDPQTGESLDPDNEEDKAKIEEIKRNEARDISFNSYYNDIYDRNRYGSLGQEAYNEMLAAEQNAAQNNIDLANAQVQQLGMAQAQTVKNITDQLRAERMSMLRAGMSESQIANQDMQQMIANTNALNDQIAASNMAVLQGQQQMNNAQQTAYQNWLNSMNAVGTNASAMAAADTGDSYMQTLKRMNKTGESYKAANDYITGRINNTTK